MALSQESLDALATAKQAVQDYRDQRVAEIDDLVSNLKNYGVPLDSLSVGTSDAATDEAFDTINSLLG